MLHMGPLSPDHSVQVAQMEFVSSLADAVKAKAGQFWYEKATLQIESIFDSYIFC